MSEVIPARPARKPDGPIKQNVEPAKAPNEMAIISDDAALREEVARLKARIAELEAGNDLRAVMSGVPMTSTISGPKAKFRVKLPGLNPRVVDDLGRATYPEYMVVDGVTEADAFATFCKLNGIISTTQTPTIERVEA